MAKFSVPMNWQEDFFDKINFSGAYEVYGKLREDFTGGGKSSMAQAEPTRKQVCEAVGRIHKMGLEFNYLLNTTCMGNLEVTKNGYKSIRKLLDWVCETGADRVTIAMPFMSYVITKYYPQLKMSVSTQAGVNSLEKVVFWEELGADSFTLSNVDMNRDFTEIKRITGNSKSKFQLLANMICKRRCPFVTLHGNFNAHASQSWAKTNRYNMDYYCLHCLAYHFSDPLTIIKGNWIRPEDIGLFEGLGVSRFKLAERGMRSDALALILDAYSKRRYDGNFMDLIPTMGKYFFAEDRNFVKTVRELFRISLVNVAEVFKVFTKWSELRKSEGYNRDLGIYINNRDLDGVTEFFMKKDCMSVSCAGCGYCENLAKKIVRVNPAEVQYEADMKKLRGLFDDLVTGKYF
jgi:collagenase-like PrtC family protease